MDDTRIDLQTVKTAAQLHDNAFVRFQAEATLAATAGANLTGGTDGTAGDAAYQTFLDQIEPYTFHALGCLSDKPAVKALFTAFTKRMRDESGVKFQTVLHRYGQADYEGVISVENGLTGAADDTSAVWWTTGAQAGCAVNKSLTNRVYDGEFEIDTQYTQAQLEEGIQSGGFLLHRVGDETRVLTDINTFVSATEERSSDFGSNQTIRVLDQIGNDIAALFNTNTTARYRTMRQDAFRCGTILCATTSSFRHCAPFRRLNRKCDGGGGRYEKAVVSDGPRHAGKRDGAALYGLRCRLKKEDDR